MQKFEPVIKALSRAEGRRLSRKHRMPATSLQITRHRDRILVGIVEPGYVELTDVEAVQLSNALLKLAGEPEGDDPID